MTTKMSMIKCAEWATSRPQQPTFAVLTASLFRCELFHCSAFYFRAPCVPPPQKIRRGTRHCFCTENPSMPVQDNNEICLHCRRQQSYRRRTCAFCHFSQVMQWRWLWRSLADSQRKAVAPIMLHVICLLRVFCVTFICIFAHRYHILYAHNSILLLSSYMMNAKCY